MLKHLAVITAGFSEVWNMRNHRPNNVCQSVTDCNKQTKLSEFLIKGGIKNKLKNTNKSFQKCSHL